MRLKHAPGRLLQHVLIAANIGHDPKKDDLTEDDWPVYSRRMPPEPDRCIACATTDPLLITDLLQGPKKQWLGVQVMVRSPENDHDGGWDKTSEIDHFFHNSSERRLELPTATYLLHQAYLDSGPLDIGMEEETERNLFTLNYLLHVTRVV